MSCVDRQEYQKVKSLQMMPCQFLCDLLSVPKALNRFIKNETSDIDSYVGQFRFSPMLVYSKDKLTTAYFPCTKDR
jgi:hypothetical protein